MASLLYIEKVPYPVSNFFDTRLREIAAFLQVDPNWIMQVLFSESRINPLAQNKSKKDGHLIAAGILQWTKESGVPGAPQSILNKNLLQQLELVKEYFTPYKGRMKSYFDVYLVTFFPAAIGKDDSYVFQTNKYSPGLIASQNPAINKDGNNEITMSEFKQYVFNSIPKTFRDVVFSKVVQGGLGLLIAATFFF